MRRLPDVYARMILRFNPRTPCGVRLGRLLACKHLFLFQSTHSLRSATHQIVHYGGALPVSIHALLAECDGGGPCLGPGRPGFNPRTPCGVRQWLWLRATRGRWFQSTHSLRSATVRPVPPGWAGRCFNPRTPCGVRHFKRRMLPVSFSFQSTHSLRSATQRLGDILRLNWFQSTHSLRSATGIHANHPHRGNVSIHALLAECDKSLRAGLTSQGSFNPRTPCGVRRL